MKVISTDKVVKDLMDEYYRYKKIGDEETAQYILKLATHTNAIRVDMKAMIVPVGCSIS